MDIGLSILIPVYNWDVTSFVTEIHKQGIELNIPFEILVYNDASPKVFNTDFKHLEHLTYKMLQQNIGRSAIRNRLAKDAQYSKLLFLDGDSYPKSEQFLKNYWNTTIDHKTILCGGTAYKTLNKGEQPSLRWVYGKEREELKAGEKGFTSNNFMISKQAFTQVVFNENIKGYGHEDTLFGIDCQRAGYTFRSCNAPLLHLGLESDEIFIAKTKEAVINLKKLYKQGKLNRAHSKLIAFHETVKFKTIVRLSIGLIIPVLMFLVKKKYNLKAFDMLKWYWFARV